MPLHLRLCLKSDVNYNGIEYIPIGASEKRMCMNQYYWYHIPQSILFKYIEEFHFFFL